MKMLSVYISTSNHPSHSWIGWRYCSRSNSSWPFWSTDVYISWPRHSSWRISSVIQCRCPSPIRLILLHPPFNHWRSSFYSFCLITKGCGTLTLTSRQRRQWQHIVKEMSEHSSLQFFFLPTPVVPAHVVVLDTTIDLSTSLTKDFIVVLSSHTLYVTATLKMQIKNVTE